LLPTEHQLCEEFDLSRFTVREALRRMTDMGMLVRVTRKGTRVISDHPGTAYVQPLDSIEEVMMHVRDTRLNVVSVDMLSVDPALAEQLGCKPGETWLRISGLRETRDKQLPLSWTDIYVVERYSGIMGELKSSSKAIYELIETRYGEKIAEIEQEISATNVQAAMALALQVRPGSPALLVIRRAFNERGDVIEISVNTQPASRYTFSLRVGRHRTSVRQTLSSEAAT
jgi:DNA-binding GntR family transcriptional regulator